MKQYICSRFLLIVSSLTLTFATNVAPGESNEISYESTSSSSSSGKSRHHDSDDDNLVPLHTNYLPTLSDDDEINEPPLLSSPFTSARRQHSTKQEAGSSSSSQKKGAKRKEMIGDERRKRIKDSDLTIEKIEIVIEALSKDKKDRLWRFAQRALDEPDLTMEKWTSFQASHPLQTISIYREWRQLTREIALKAWYRKKLKEDENNAAVLRGMTQRGWTLNDLAAKQQQLSTMQAQERIRERKDRKHISDKLRRLRKEVEMIDRFGKCPYDDDDHDDGSSSSSFKEQKDANRKRIIYKGREECEKLDTESIQSVHGKSARRISQLITDLRRRIRMDPFDPTLISLKRELDTMMQEKFRYSKMIVLPKQVKDKEVIKVKTTEDEDKKAQMEKVHPANPDQATPSYRSSTECNWNSLHHSPLPMPEDLQEMIRTTYDTPGKRTKYVESLFDPSDLYPTSPQRKKAKERRVRHTPERSLDENRFDDEDTSIAVMKQKRKKE